MAGQRSRPLPNPLEAMTTFSHNQNVTTLQLARQVLGDGCPSILYCEEPTDEDPRAGEWKVSPYGDIEPDRDCFWVDTHTEAIEEAAAAVRERAKQA
jgi:hypothetical protein